MIRLATANDAAEIAEIYRPAIEESATSFEVVAPTAEVMRGRIADTLEQYPWLVDEQDGRVTGYVYAWRHAARAGYRWTVDTSLYVHRDFHRQGVGRELNRALFAVLRAQGIHKVMVGITLPNEASERLHDAMGFRRVGVIPAVGYRHGQWRDVAWWHLSLREPTTQQPPEPIPFAEMAADWQDEITARFEVGS